MVLGGNNIFGNAKDEGKRETYLSIPPCAFIPTDLADVVTYSAASLNMTNASPPSQLFAPVILPHNATITSAIVFGDAGLAGDSWSLNKERLDGTASSNFLGESINVEGKANNAGMVIDNQNFSYTIVVNGPDDGDKLYGARITYTK